MNRLLSVLLFSLVILSGCTYGGPDDDDPLFGFPDVVAPPPLPDSVAEAYMQDATHLAVFGTNRAGILNPPIEIPAALRQTLYNALGHVWHAMDIPARDSVVDLYDIHAFQRRSLTELVVGVDPDASWVRAWFDGATHTGEPSMDRLINEWNFTLTEPLEPGCSRCFAVLEADQPLNLLAISPHFIGIDGIESIRPKELSGDGDVMEALPTQGRIFLRYSHGFGDCSNVCTERHTWEFYVRTNGAVEFEVSYGDPLP